MIDDARMFLDFGRQMLTMNSITTNITTSTCNPNHYICSISNSLSLQSII